MLTTCPACAGPLRVRRLDCPACATSVEGTFSLGRLGRLTREQRELVEVFLEARGKIKDVELALGVSYPTVVARLDELVAALGPRERPTPAARAAAPVDASDPRTGVLEALARGEISKDEAKRRLAAIDRGGA